MPTASPKPVLTVLAGVNGAGKSSVGGEMLRKFGAVYFNPDEAAALIRSKSPSISQKEANSIAWNYGKTKLTEAIASKTDFTFESTLGGKTITSLLISAARKTHQLDIWFVGLISLDLHLERVAQRVAKGGHPIPETAIRRRWISSRENIIRLIPFMTNLRVFDNSTAVETEKIPEPVLILSIEKGTLTYPKPIQTLKTPDWAKPIVAAAWKHFGF